MKSYSALCLAFLVVLLCSDITMAVHRRHHSHVKSKLFHKLNKAKLRDLAQYPLNVKAILTSFTYAADNYNSAVTVTINEGACEVVLTTTQLGPAVGKELLRTLGGLADNAALNSCTASLSMKIDGKLNPQFTGFYTLTPPKPFGAKGGIVVANLEEEAQRPIKYEFTANSDIYQVFGLLTTMVSNPDGSNKVGLYPDKMPFPLKFKPFTLVFPEEEKYCLSLKYRLYAATAAFVAAGYEAEASKSFATSIATYLNERGLGCFDGFDPDQAVEAPAQAIAQAYDFNAILESSEAQGAYSFQGDITEADVIMCPSDETTHVFHDGTTIYVIDAGSRALRKTLKDIKTKVEGITSIQLFATHFHDDHMQALTALASDDELAPLITLRVSKHEVMEVYGWFVANYDIVKKAEGGFKIAVEFFDGVASQPFEVGTYNVRPYHADKGDEFDVQMRHFLACTSYVFTKGDKALIFSGDLNPQFSDEYSAERDFKPYRQKIINNLDAEAISNVHFFDDYGHFGTDYIEQWAAIGREGMTVHWYLEHQKLETGYTVAQINLDAVQRDHSDAINLYGTYNLPEQ